MRRWLYSPLKMFIKTWIIEYIVDFKMCLRRPVTKYMKILYMFSRANKANLSSLCFYLTSVNYFILLFRSCIIVSHQNVLRVRKMSDLINWFTVFLILGWETWDHYVVLELNYSWLRSLRCTWTELFLVHEWWDNHCAAIENFKIDLLLTLLSFPCLPLKQCYLFISPVNQSLVMFVAKSKHSKIAIVILGIC